MTRGQRGDVGRLEPRLPEDADGSGGSVAPTSSDGSSRVPASAGASQSEWSRVHSQVHATFGLSGSLPAGLNDAQPHDQTSRSRSSDDTCFAASASHFVDVEPLRERLQALTAAGGRASSRTSA